VEDPVRILGLWKFRDTGVFVNVAIAFPSSLILTDAFHIQTCDLSDVMGNSLASLGRAFVGAKNRFPPRSFPSTRLLDLHQTDGRGLLNKVGQNNHHSLIMRFLDQRSEAVR
jgi:hypothetical protein